MSKQCDPGLVEAVSTIVWCAPRLRAEVQELAAIAKMFGMHYGKDFIKCAMGNTADVYDPEAPPNTTGIKGTGAVSKRVEKKMNDFQPK
jgi:hypothetical protein